MTAGASHRAGHAAMLERLALYAARRDARDTPADAARATGISEATAVRYEREYRRGRGLPDPRKERRAQERRSDRNGGWMD